MIARGAAAAVIAAAAAAVLLLAALVVTGRLHIVVTHGVSMQPLYHQGDLIVMVQAPSYHVGEIVGYRVPSLHLVVLHRLIVEHHGYFAFKGDNNQSIDPWHPSFDQLMGHAVLRIPQGGVWLERATSPFVIATVVALLLASGGVNYGRRRRRRRMAAHSRTARSARGRGNSPLPPAWRGLGALLAAIAVGGLAFAGLAWTTPRTHIVSVTSQQQRQMTFSYQARVKPSAAYGGTIVRSPDPVFRKLASAVDIQFRYSGPPGPITVAAQLSAPSGWRTQLALTPRPAAVGDGSTHLVTLDLPTLDAKAAAAEAATGMSTTPLSVAIVPKVATASGQPFAPSLQLNLSPLQLSLADGAKSLTVADATPVSTQVRQPQRFAFAGRSITVSVLRIVSLILIAIALLGGAALIIAARRLRDRSAADAVSRRYNVHVVEVQPLPSRPDRPVIEVRTVADLIQLATQLGLPVLHWGQRGVDTFAVHDEVVVYRTSFATPATEVAEPDFLTIVGRPA